MVGGDIDGGLLDVPEAGEAAAEDAREVLLQLDKSLRVCRLYDSGNEMVTKFVDGLRDVLMRYLGRHGDLVLRVRPASFMLGRTVIDGAGLDELALALFRQGVHALRVTPRMNEPQLRKLLGILVVGLRGGDNAEEDLVTLLWRAQLPGVRYSAVLGYQELGADDELGLDAESVGETLGEALHEDLAQMSGEARAIVEEKQRLLRAEPGDVPDALRGLLDDVEEEQSPALIAHLLLLLQEALGMDSAGELFDDAQVERLLAAMLDALGNAGNIEGVSQLATTLRTLAESTPGFAFGAAVMRVLDRGLDDATFVRLLEDLPGGIADHADEVTRVIKTFARGRLEMIAALADRQESERDRSILNGILTEMASVDPEFLVSRFRSSEDRRAVETLAILARLDVQRARQAVAVRLPSAPPDTQRALLVAMRSIPDLYDERLRTSLLRLAHKGGRLRMPIFESFLEHPDPAIADTVASWVQDDDFESWAADELRGALEVLAVHDEDKALEYVRGVLGRKKLFGRRALSELKATVVSALATSDSAASRKLLEEHADSKDKNVKAACDEALGQIRRRAATRAGGVIPGGLP